MYFYAIMTFRTKLKMLYRKVYKEKMKNKTISREDD